MSSARAYLFTYLLIHYPHPSIHHKLKSQISQGRRRTNQWRAMVVTCFITIYSNRTITDTFSATFNIPLILGFHHHAPQKEAGGNEIVMTSKMAQGMVLRTNSLVSVIEQRPDGWVVYKDPGIFLKSFTAASSIALHPPSILQSAVESSESIQSIGIH